MSGMMNDERYQRMVERVRSGHGHSYNATHSSMNATRPISTHQFYNSTTNFQDRSLMPSTMNASAMPNTYLAPTAPPSTSYAPSESSVFKAPLPVKHNKLWTKHAARYQTCINILMEVDNKSVMKLGCRSLEELVHTIRNCPHLVSNPTLLWDTICNNVREKYYSDSRIPSLISSSSMSSMSAFGERSNDFGPGPGSVFSTSTAAEDPMQFMMNPRVVLEQTSLAQQAQHAQLSVSRNDQRAHQQSVRVDRDFYEELVAAAQACGRGPPSFTATSTSTAVAKTKQRPLPVADTPRSRARNRKAAQPAGRPATSKLQATPMVNGRLERVQEEQGNVTVTRAGRQVKPPAPFWTGNQSYLENSHSPPPKKSNSAESKSGKSSNKAAAAKANAVRKGAHASDTPLRAIPEGTVPRPKPKQKNNNSKNLSNGETDKENILTSKPQAKKTAKNKTASVPGNKTDPKDNSKNSSRVNAKINSSVAPKQNGSKPGRKRKSQNSLEESKESSKKKKVEKSKVAQMKTVVREESDSDDDLFAAFPRQKMGVSTQAVSPSGGGMLSAKKAVAGAAAMKETPPCKAFGQMLDASHLSEARSTLGREPPKAKMTQVAKRVVKNMEKSQKEEKSKPVAKKEAPHAKKPIPLGKHIEGAVTYTMSLGEELDDDDDDDEDDEDEDDISDSEDDDLV